MKDSKTIWQAAERAIVAGDAPALEQLLREHAAMFREQPPQSSWCGGLAPNYAGADARAIVTREHHFANFDDLAKHLAEMKRADGAAAQFEAAVDAIAAGDAATLENFLRVNPNLIRARSPRTHRSTLLHYVGANGVESWRQKTPQNAAQIAEILLAAGAEVDAMAEMYGGSTTLGLVATSIHPLLAGVQNQLMEVFLNHGAALDHPQAAGNGQGVVNGCLANGRPGAARFLADRGARLDLEGAAGVGRIDRVRNFFGAAGRLQAGATTAQMKSGFQWACEYGHTEVVVFLLQQGVEVGEVHRGQTGLHWAAYGGHLEIVQLLLEKGAPVNVPDERWQNTPLGWALHGYGDPPREFGGARYHEVVARLVAAGSVVEPKWLLIEKVRVDRQMFAVLGGEITSTPPGKLKNL